ncbi:hypothetical protein NGM10_14220 [Halorussus salilacus]|uniref:HalOD1 output domain-containing protein n=1 Tax=Halorussus salilacus TaxID=2953750 RepID=UPI00209EE6BF|nr:HalOD1 output domain-containing protein [Halorussus salilacus]USZ67876.1 hypothetical protein NGM10_14220 [Halorussus salilacus]
MTNATDRSGADFVRELDREESPSEAVYTVVAAVSNCLPTDLEPLADRIDPDALDSLFGQRSASASAQIEFDYAGYEVTVTPEAVLLRERDGGRR